MNYEEYLQKKRIEEYRNDPFIKGCVKIIESIIQLATPMYVIKDGNFENISFTIDEGTKSRIKVWEKHIQDHIENRYSDLFPKVKLHEEV